MYKSIEQITKEFELKNGSKEDIRKQLKLRLKDCHPDKNGGVFKTAEHQVQFEKLSSAIEFLDTPVEIELRREISDLSKIIMDFAIKKNDDEVLIKKEENLSKKIESNVNNYASAHLFPKITSSIIAGLLSILWLFPKTISEHKILSKFIDIESPNFAIFWLLTLVCSGCIWLILTMRERRDKELKNSLKLDSVQNMLFDEFIRHLNVTKYDSNTDVISFTKEAFIHFIRGFNLKYHKYRSDEEFAPIPNNTVFGNSRIDMGLAQDLSEIILNRMQSKELVKVKTQKTISDIYIVELDEEMKNYYR